MSIGPDTILVVEEKAEIVNLLAEALEPRGYNVVGANGLHQALALVRSTPSLRLIVSDLSMSSVDLIRRACRSRPQVQVLFLSDGMTNIPFRESDPVLLNTCKIDTLTEAVRLTLEGPQVAAVDWGLGPERRRMAAR
jgi:CheY-like chemotaxis protein